VCLRKELRPLEGLQSTQEQPAAGQLVQGLGSTLCVVSRTFVSRSAAMESVCALASRRVKTAREHASSAPSRCCSRGWSGRSKRKAGSAAAARARVSPSAGSTFRRAGIGRFQLTGTITHYKLTLKTRKNPEYSRSETIMHLPSDLDERHPYCARSGAH
jgi:hypothetical protein